MSGIDITGLTVFPGVVDAHLHLGHGKDIARPRIAGDAAQETAAAAGAGITTFIPYLMATEPFEVIFEDVRAVTEAGARIDLVIISSFRRKPNSQACLPMRASSARPRLRFS